MRDISDNTIPPGQNAGPGMKVFLFEYPLYIADEDIYMQHQKAVDIDETDISDTEDPAENDDVDSVDEEDADDDLSGDDLDVPGSELDDEQEAIGNEDEENNYYSLGGDNHNDLEEDQGD